MAMQVGIVLPIGQEDGMIAAPAYGEVRAVAIEAETVGLDSVWVYDHLLFRFDGETTGIHECWTVLSAIAEATSTSTSTGATAFNARTNRSPSSNDALAASAESNARPTPATMPIPICSTRLPLMMRLMNGGVAMLLPDGDLVQFSG